MREVMSEAGSVLADVIKAKKERLEQLQKLVEPEPEKKPKEKKVMVC